MNARMTRRALLAGAGAATAGLTLGMYPRIGRAQAPSEMEVIVGFSPGGGTDRSVRVIVPAWANALGGLTPTYTYAPGAGGVIAVQQMLAGAKDGTVINAIPAPYTAWHFALEEGNYTADDVAWIGGYFDDPDVLLVGKDSPYDTIDQFIEDAQTTEKTVAVSAPMSASHAATVVLREETGAKLRIVPFNGGSESRNAVAGGHVDSCMAPYWSATHVLDLTKAIGIFAPENPAPDLWQPVPVNEVLGMQLPDLTEPYCMQVASQVRDEAPETYQALVSAFEQAVASDEAKAAAAQNQGLDRFMVYRSPENCTQWVSDYLALLSKYRPAMEADLDRL